MKNKRKAMNQQSKDDLNNVSNRLDRIDLEGPVSAMKLNFTPSELLSIRNALDYLRTVGEI